MPDSKRLESGRRAATAGSARWARLRNMARANPLFRNVGANFLGSGWTGLLIVLATPAYVSLLGMEGYGLIGFWILMQVVLSLFDLGMGATLVREFAAEGPPGNGSRKGDLLRTLEYLYWPLAILLTLGILLSARGAALHWLHLNALPVDRAAQSLRWMALALGLQFPCALYSSGLAGLQLQGRMNLLQMLAVLLRHGGGVLILSLEPDPVRFFFWQALVSGAQTAATGAVLKGLLKRGGTAKPVFRPALLREVWRFSAGMACTVIAGVLLANVDRLVLSKMLPIEELGKYTAAVTAAGVLQFGIQPFYRAYFPKFAELCSAGSIEALRREYYRGSRLVAALILPAAVLGWIFAPQIFGVWLKRADATIVTAFRWLLVGMGAAGLTWLPAAYQQACGWTRLHAGMILAALGLGLPCLFWAIGRWGAPGAACVWVLHGLSDLTLGLWLMHRRLLIGEILGWYRAVILPPLLFSLPIVWLSRFLMPAGLGRWATGAWLGVTGLAVVSGLLAYTKFRPSAGARSANAA